MCERERVCVVRETVVYTFRNCKRKREREEEDEQETESVCVCVCV